MHLDELYCTLQLFKIFISSQFTFLHHFRLNLSNYGHKHSSLHMESGFGWLWYFSRLQEENISQWLTRDQRSTRSLQSDLQQWHAPMNTRILRCSSHKPGQNGQISILDFITIRRSTLLLELETLSPGEACINHLSSVAGLLENQTSTPGTTFETLKFWSQDGDGETPRLAQHSTPPGLDTCVTNLALCHFFCFASSPS